MKSDLRRANTVRGVVVASGIPTTIVNSIARVRMVLRVIQPGAKEPFEIFIGEGRFGYDMRDFLFLLGRVADR